MNSVVPPVDPSVELDDVMLAMDVVDTLRHQQSLVDHALNADERDRALTARIRKIYSEQGIEVTDAVVADGVRALREERFSYKPPPGGVKSFLARAYVQRKNTYKPLVVACVALGLVWAAYYAMYTLPQRRENIAAMDAYNQRVIESQNRVVSVKGLLERAAEAIDQERSISPEMREFEPLVRSDTINTVNSAQRLANAASAIKTSMTTDVDDYLEERAPLHAQLSEREALVKQLTAQADTVTDGVALLGLLATVPAQADQLLKTIGRAATDSTVNDLASKHADNAIAALKRQDPAAAKAAMNALVEVADEVQAEYQILVVSRPGEKSGVWRFPKDNRAAKNYYLIVEAVAANGTRLAKRITSEEDGSVRKVNQWGMRVDQNTYNRISADKADDGIIQNKVFAVKRRGTLTPEFVLTATGGSITAW